MGEHQHFVQRQEPLKAFQSGPGFVPSHTVSQRLDRDWNSGYHAWASALFTVLEICFYLSIWLRRVSVAAHGGFCCSTDSPAGVCQLGSVVSRLQSAQVYFLRGMESLSFPTRDQTRIPCIARWILNHWTTREVPEPLFLNVGWLFFRFDEASRSGDDCWWKDSLLFADPQKRGHSRPRGAT